MRRLFRRLNWSNITWRCSAHFVAFCFKSSLQRNQFSCYVYCHKVNRKEKFLGCFFFVSEWMRQQFCASSKFKSYNHSAGFSDRDKHGLYSCSVCFPQCVYVGRDQQKDWVSHSASIVRSVCVEMKKLIPFRMTDLGATYGFWKESKQNCLPPAPENVQWWDFLNNKQNYLKNGAWEHSNSKVNTYVFFEESAGQKRKY